MAGTGEVASSPGPQSIDVVMRRITEISTLPHVALRVMGVANDPNAGVSDLRAVVEGDPALSTRVLRCVNSAASGLRFRVTDLQRAISFLGFKQIRNLAVTASVSEVFAKNAEIGPYSRSGLWRHLVSVAVCSRMIAARQKMASFEEVFLAGLLHDVGIIIEDQYCHEGFEGVMNGLTSGQTLAQTEQRVLGFDHARLGARLAEQWKFPVEVRDTIRYHHAPQTYRGEHEKVLGCVVLANLLCTLRGDSSVGMNLLRADLWSVHALGLNEGEVKVLAIDLDRELSENRALFKL